MGKGPKRYSLRSSYVVAVTVSVSRFMCGHMSVSRFKCSHSECQSVMCSHSECQLIHVWSHCVISSGTPSLCKKLPFLGEISKTLLMTASGVRVKHVAIGETGSDKTILDALSDEQRRSAAPCALVTPEDPFSRNRT
ncbi:hypothetical protein STEG23_013874 [Scotinomys teguina]